MRDARPAFRLTQSELEAQVQALKAQLAEAFSVEEMDCIREQLAERARSAKEARDQLEWKLRMELVRVREAESSALRAASEMGQVAASIASLLGEEDDENEDTRPAILRRGGSSRQRLHA